MQGVLVSQVAEEHRYSWEPDLRASRAPLGTEQACPSECEYGSTSRRYSEGFRNQVRGSHTPLVPAQDHILCISHPEPSPSVVSLPSQHPTTLNMTSRSTEYESYALLSNDERESFEFEYEGDNSSGGTLSPCYPYTLPDLRRTRQLTSKPDPLDRVRRTDALRSHGCSRSSSWSPRPTASPSCTCRAS